MTQTSFEIPVDQLRARFDPETLPFRSTEELVSLEGVIGQERAVRAMDFGLHIQDRGYNIFVSGIPGTGKNTLIKSMVKKSAGLEPTPPDWCYVHNFQDPDRPRALSLPAGEGKNLKQDMGLLIQGLKAEFPKVFQSKEFQDQRQAVEEKYGRAKESLSRQLEEQARLFGFHLKSTPMGIVIFPLVGGRPLQPEEVEGLDPEKRKDFEKKEQELRKHVHTYAQQVRELKDEMNAEIEDCDRRAAHFISESSFERLREKYTGRADVLSYIQEVQEDALNNFRDFLPEPENPLHFAGIEIESPKKQMTRYSVNLVVDHSETRGAPVIDENNPIYNNLVGRIEKRGRLGALYTDFTLIRGGALLQASGGFLLLNALDVLRSPFSWDALKRVIKTGELKIEDIGELYGLIASAGIKPEPIPVRIRIILIGNPEIYYLLQAYDEDFPKMFKVKADFEAEQNQDGNLPLRFSEFLARLCRDENLLHFDREGVASMMEESARLVDHQKKFSLQFSRLANLARESSYWAKKEKHPLVTRGDVNRAVEENLYRANLLEERIQDLIREGTLMVDVSGEVVGQINGLSVHQLGEFSFGRPSRITARVFLGQSGIINIEREARLSGKTHSKGVMILSGYLGGRYAVDFPLSLSATLCFEQSYGEVEGDSASVAELITLLSCLGNIPIPQGIAVTGSVNQRGELQPVGGVNEKIEGFFTVCRILGVDGKQGVIIPKRNLTNLMLKEEVRKAVAGGRFHIYAAETVDEVLEILSGRSAGKPDPDGGYPADTLNGVILNRLKEMGERLRELGPPMESPVMKKTEGELISSGPALSKPRTAPRKNKTGRSPRTKG